MTPCYKRRKVRYRTKHQAKVRAMEVFRVRSVVLDTYLCVECGFWHVGHAMNKMKRRELEKQYNG